MQAVKWIFSIYAMLVSGIFNMFCGIAGGGIFLLCPHFDPETEVRAELSRGWDSCGREWKRYPKKGFILVRRTGAG